MASNNTFTDEYGEADDWVELYNNNDNPILLDSVFLSDDVDDKMKWQLDGSVVIPSNGFMLFWLDDAPDQGALHAPFKLSSSGESLHLSHMQNSSLIVIDAISFGAIPDNISYGREMDGSDDWVHFSESSPNDSNNGNELFLNAQLDFSLPAGFYESSVSVEITSSISDVEIYYSTDGSEPDVNSIPYFGPIPLIQTNQIRAIAFDSILGYSQIKEDFYLINAAHELPVVHLSIDPKYLWDEQEGMYISGQNGIQGYCSDVPRNWNQDWERPATVQYFEADGNEAFQVKAGLKIAGGCSRGLQMKGFNVFLRNSEYGDNEVDYPLFKDYDIEKFRRFKLRASGNDFEQTMVRDASIQSLLFNQVDIDLMAYDPVVLYLNGEYWGCYGIREFYNKHYISDHHQVDKDSLDLIKNPYQNQDVKEGDLIAWNQLRNYVYNNDLTIQSKFDYVADQIDINEYINYNVAQIYIANYDWPANNVAIWRHRNNGKWRWMLYDTDISSNYGVWSDSYDYTNTLSYATAPDGPNWPNSPASTFLLRKLLENEKFKAEFAQRICTFARTIFTPNRTSHFIDSLSAKIASEIPATISKYNNTPASWSNWNSSPMGGSIGNWNNYLSTFKAFFNNRFTNIRDDFKDKFNYAGDFKLKLNFDENTNGTVVLHENKMKIPYLFEGYYFDNVPIKVTAIAKRDYYFIRWKETGDTTAVIYYESNTNAVLTPIFLKEGEIEPEEPEIVTPPVIPPTSIFELYPVPANTSLTIKHGEVSRTHFSFRIFDAGGRLVLERNLVAEVIVQEYNIDITSWPNGVYFFEAKIGEREVLEKVMVLR